MRRAAVVVVASVLAGVFAAACGVAADRAEPAAVPAEVPSGSSPGPLEPPPSLPTTTTTTALPSSVPPPPPASPPPPPSSLPTTTAAGPSTSSTIARPPIATRPADIGRLAPEDRRVPVGLRIDGFADGPVMETGVDQLGELAVPPEAGLLAWYRFGPTPGAPGSAVIAGHVNWHGSPGVFVSLADVPVGAEVTVSYDDATERRFVITEIELVPKPEVALSDVFVRDGPPTLRLVTCGGEFDSTSRHYRSNVIATAVPVE